MIGKIINLCLVLMFVTSCATLSKDECLTANWYDIGLKDGQEGENKDQLAKHTKACKEYNVTPQSDKYLEGYSVGIKSFCLPENGYDLGRKGHHYQKSCPTEIEGKFLVAYHLGKEIYDLEEEIKSLTSKIEEIEDKMVSDYTKPQEKEKLAKEKLQYDRKLRKKEKELNTLQWSKAATDIIRAVKE